MKDKDFHQAWLVYSFARWPVPNSPGKQRAYEKALEAWLAHARKFDPPVELLKVPFEGKEVVGGYFLIRAETLDEAAEMAKDCPIFESGGSVEVRAIQVINP